MNVGVEVVYGLKTLKATGHYQAEGLCGLPHKKAPAAIFIR